MGYFEPVKPGQTVQASPGAGQDVPVWILGSSTYGAQLAAALGLPFAFASHFAPAQMDAALAVYRQQFEPSTHLDKPYVMLGLNVFAAPTDEEAKLLFSSAQQQFVALRTGRPGLLPPPVEDYEDMLEPHLKALLSGILSAAVVGSPATVKKGVADFIARTGADELMITSNMFDPAARRRSFAIVAEARDALAAKTMA
jgi:luciferase family oxidoreductase group 1